MFGVGAISERNPPLTLPLRARGRIVAVEPSERTRGHHTDKQNAHPAAMT